MKKGKHLKWFILLLVVNLLAYLVYSPYKKSVTCDSDWAIYWSGYIIVVGNLLISWAFDND